MPEISISVLGGCGVSIDARPIAGVPSSLFRMVAFIILSGHNLSAPRQRLSSVLWPDIDRGKANGNLRQVLSRIRTFQNEIDVHFIQSNFSLVYIEPSPSVHCDLLELFMALRQTDTANTVALASLYPGDLLVDLADSGPDFEDWLSHNRDALRDKVINRLVAALDAGSELSLDERALCAQQLLVVDPCNEDAFRALMINAAAHGNFGRVLSLYEHCQRRLMHDLGVRPSEETVALFDHLSTHKVQ